MIRYAKESDVARIKQLHRENIKDEGFIKFYDKNIYNYKHTLVNEENDEILACVDVIPHKIMLKGRRVGAYTINALCNVGLKEHFVDLLDTALDYCDRQVLITFINSNDYDTYKRFGFETKYYYQEYAFKAKNYPNYGTAGISTYTNVDDLNNLYKEFISHFQGAYIQEEKKYEYYLAFIQSIHGQCYTYYSGGKLEGYYVSTTDGDTAYIEEIIYNNGEALARLLAHASNRKNNVIVRCSKAERLDKIIPFAKTRTDYDVLVRINDHPLFRKCYQLSKDESFNSIFSYKPLYFHERY